jgi:hypothetical protein
MGEKTFSLAIWPRLHVMDSFEIVGIGMDCTGNPYVVGCIGPYLTKEEAESDLHHITEKDLKKQENSKLTVDF